MTNNEFFSRLIEYADKIEFSKLKAYEDNVFTEKIDKRTRASIELDRLKTKLSNSPDVYAEYFDDIKKIDELLDIAEFDSTVLDDVYVEIIRIQASCGQKTRLYSGIGKVIKTMAAEYEIKKGI